MHKNFTLLFYGFAIFSMFFGSGNLVFPLQIGRDTGSEWFLGFLGLLCTGVILPLLGLFVIKKYRGHYSAFFSEAGDLAKFLLPLTTLSLIGAFGVVPRCITVAHAGISYIFPNIHIALFSVIFCAACFFICLKDSFMVNFLGKWLSPILLIFLAVLIALGIIYAPLGAAPPLSSESSFAVGFFSGYQTMDLFAAFFFAALIFKQIQNALGGENVDTKTIIRYAIKPSIIGASLLALVYIGFVFLGAQHASLVRDLSPEMILPAIAFHVLGSTGSFVLGIVVIFSCLTTAVALNNIYADYLRRLFKLSEKKFPLVLFITTAVSFVISMLNFRGIAAFLSPILVVTYPSIIVLTMMCLFLNGHTTMKKNLFYLTLVFTIVYTYFPH